MLTSRTSPTMTVIRNGGTHRFGARIVSTTITTRSTRIVAGVLARSVTNWSICVDQGNGVVVGPAADARVEPGEIAARAHEVGERSERDAADHGDRERNGEREPGRRSRIEAAAEQAREPRVPNGLLGELLSRCGCRRRGCSCRCRIATRQEGNGDAGSESEKEEDDEGHGCWGRLPRPPAGKRGNGSRRCPPGNEPGRACRPPSRPLARSRIAATARGRRCSSPRPAGRQSGSPPRSARVIPFAYSSLPFSAATRSCSR